MYAIIMSGGKQYKAEAGSVIRVEKLDAEIGAEVEFDVLLAVDGETVTAGDPLVKNCEVKGKVLAHGKAKKIVVFKYKKKKNYRKKQGHRQPFTSVEIVAVGDDKVEEKIAAAPESEAVSDPEDNKADDVKAKAAGAAPAAKKVAQAKKTPAPVKKTGSAKPAAKKTETKSTAAASKSSPAAKKTGAAKTAGTAQKKPAAAKKAPVKKTGDTKAEKKTTPVKKDTPAKKAAPAKKPATVKKDTPAKKDAETGSEDKQD